jgi:chitin synthase
MSPLLKKIAIIGTLIIINVLISVLMFVYDKYSWYLVFISLSTLYKILLIFLIIAYVIVFKFKSMLCVISNNDIESQNQNKKINVGILVPCYTEGNFELKRTFESIKMSSAKAKTNKNINIVCIVVIDGKNATSNTVQELLQCSLSQETEYMSWKNESVKVDVGYTSNDYGNYIVLCKNNNMGKKDSLIIMRELIGKKLNNSLQSYFNAYLASNEIEDIDYLVGVDADTRLHEDFIVNILKTSEPDNVLGVSGYAIPDKNCTSLWNPLFFYQSFEYHQQQGLTRLGQSILGKVTCLPGCAQVWKMDGRTLNEPLEHFKLYKNKDSITQSIRALLGEDRRYTGLVLYKNKDCQTLLCNNAYAYTRVPATMSVFLSQRRRWFLSSQVNNIRDMLSSNLPWFIRFIAFTQLWNSAFILVNMVAMIKFCLSLRHPTIFTLIASSFYLFIMLYKLSLCILKSSSILNSLYLIGSAICYSVFAPLMNLIITFYGLFTMSDLKWGSTQIESSIE